jgi:hypothetical protein
LRDLKQFEILRQRLRGLLEDGAVVGALVHLEVAEAVGAEGVAARQHSRASRRLLGVLFQTERACRQISFEAIRLVLAQYMKGIGIGHCEFFFVSEMCVTKKIRKCDQIAGFIISHVVWGEAAVIVCCLWFNSCG